MAATLVRPASARAGTFLQEPGAWLAIATSSLTTSRLRYGPAGRVAPADPYRKIETSWLLEYGLTRNVTLIANPVVRDVVLSTGQGTFTGRGLSSFEAGARWRLIESYGHAISFQALARTPGKSDPILTLENRPRTELRLGYGAPALINGKEGFVDASIAWVKRHEARADEVRYEMTYGWNPKKNRMVLLQYFTTLYPGSGLRRDPLQHKIQTSSVYRLNEQWSAQLGSFWTRGGRETRRERGTIIGVWRRF